MKNQITQEALLKTQNHGRNLEKITNLIEKKLNKAPLGVLNRVDASEEIRFKINSILNFYNLFLETFYIFEKENNFLAENFILDRKYSLKQLESKSFLLSLRNILNAKAKINKFIEILIVQELNVNFSTEKYLKFLNDCFFNDLENKIPAKLEFGKIFCDFLIEFSDKKIFFERFIRIFYEKFKFGDHFRKKNDQLEKIAQFKNIFNKINYICTDILPETEINSTFLAIKKILIADTKSNLGDSLLKIEKRNKSEDLIFLIALITIFTDIKVDFNDLREECLKLINNLLVTFSQEIGSLTKPNKFYETEFFLKTEKNLIKSFFEQPNIAKEILSNCKIYKSNTNSEFKTELINKTKQKIFELSQLLNPFNQQIYLINNFYTLKEIENTISIEEYKNKLINIWEEELKNLKDREVIGYIQDQVFVYKEYKLPEILREEIVNSFKDELYKRIKFTQKYQMDKLELEIEKMFMKE